MKIKCLFEIPILSSELDSAIEIVIKGLDITLILKYFDEKNKVLKIRFDTVLCHMHTSQSFTKALLNAYDTIVEIEDSEWINEIKKLNEDEFNFWKLKHYAIYLEDLGMYQFLARGYDVTTEE